MSYRILKISSYYRDFLTQYYNENPEIVKGSYSEQYDHIMSKGVSWSDFFARYFMELGVEAHEIVHNAAPLQRSWALENGMDLYGKDLVYEQIKKIRPDIIFFQDTLSFDGRFIDQVRNDFALKLIAGHICSPVTGDFISNLKKYDILFACPPLHFNVLNPLGINSVIFHHAFEPSLLSPVQPKREMDVFFAGSLIPGKDFHDDRIYVLDALIKQNINLKIHADVSAEPAVKYLLRYAGFYGIKLANISGLKRITRKSSLLNKFNLLKEAPKRKLFPDLLLSVVNDRPLFGKEMIQELQRSKIGLNIHGGVAGDYAANVRMFEVTGAGSLLLTDNKKNLADLFVPDKEVITFDTPDECIEKVRWLMDHQDKITEISLAGQARTLKDHTIKNRVQTLHEYFTDYIQ